MEPTKTACGGTGYCGVTVTTSPNTLLTQWSTAPNTSYFYQPYFTTTEMETEELWDFLWVYVGEDEVDEENGEEIETFPHEGRVFGTKSEVEKSLLVEFARLFTDIDVDDYALKLRKW